MNKKNSYIIIIIIGAILVAYYFLFIENVRTGNNGKQDMSYFEIVKEDPACKENCFLEYIVMSNGEIMEKNIKDHNIKNKNGINMLAAGDADVKMVSERVRDYFEKYGTNEGIDCENCSSYHLYYRDIEGKKSYAIKEGDADEDMIEILKLTESVAKKSRKSDIEFFHFFYGKKDGSYLDYHIFTNGTVIREVFGKRSGQLVESGIYLINPEQIDKLEKLLSADYFNEKNDSEMCYGRDFLWGFLEIKTRMGYNYIYTCGDGKNNSDTIFNYLYSNYD